MFELVYPNKFYPWEYSPIPVGYFEDKKNRIKSFKQLIKKIGINIEDIPKVLSYEYFDLNNDYRKFKDMINEYYNFNINSLIKECYPKEYKSFSMPYQNHYLTLDNIKVKSEPERMIHHLLIDNFDNVEYELKYFYNEDIDKRYLPDWFFNYNKKIIIIEYYGMLDMHGIDWGYNESYQKKDIYYKELIKKNNKYVYLPLYKEDIKRGMNGIVEKFKELGIKIDKLSYYN